jgi:hypothetical protein
MILEEKDKERLVRIVQRYPGFTLSEYIQMAYKKAPGSRKFEQQVADLFEECCMSFWGHNPTRRCLFYRYEGM